MTWLLRWHMLTVIVAASYLTLGVFSPGQAGDLWAPYALVMLALAVNNLVWERRR